MSGRYCYRCAECPYRSPWGTESKSARCRRIHHVRHHSGEPGGRVELRERNREGVG